ncbi:MAG: argininosuccinate lyase [Candidatus Omnitrophica bacterium]|nr:argininosuccinate lyase [Candidatus Omnitrophota bacterium]
MWGGRFGKPTDPEVERFTSSIAVDARLARYDVLGSIAHAQMLGKQRIVPAATAGKIVRGLRRILRRIEAGRFVPDAKAEDIHSDIEARLTRLVGPDAGALHTARSRNDQVALDLRLYCLDAIARLSEGIAAVQRSLVGLAQRTANVVIPGYTHLQRAQPVLFAHHLLAYVEMLARDGERLMDCRGRTAVLPLGAGALAGTSLPIDRADVAKRLGLPAIAANSLDAVSDRDFAVELLAALALLAAHLSRLAEDAILWASEEFGILELDEAFATGSSLMPHKKNPDVLELVRGQAGLASGAWVAMVTLLKGLPLSYNRDLQHDKAILFPVVEGAEQALRVLARLWRHVEVRRERIARLLDTDTMCATDLAEHLVRRGVRFRQAHETVGRIVRAAEQRGCRLRDVSLAELRAFSPQFDAGALRLLDPRRSVERKASAGSTNPRMVRRELQRWRRRLGGTAPRGKWKVAGGK